MSFNQQDSRVRAYKNRRSIVDIVRAVLYIGVGVYLLVSKNPKVKEFIPTEMMYILIGLCFLIGGFRLYSAIKQNYYLDKER